MKLLLAIPEKALGYRDPDDWAVEIAKRDELYAKSPFCSFCEGYIDEKSEATALYFNRRMKWKLSHVHRCALELVDAENERLRSLRQHGECLGCNEPAAEGRRFCVRCDVEAHS